MSLTYDVLKDDVRAGRPIDFGFVTYVPERTCRVLSCDLHTGGFGCEEAGAEWALSCGHVVINESEEYPPNYCSECGAKVVSDDADR